MRCFPLLPLSIAACALHIVHSEEAHYGAQWSPMVTSFQDCEPMLQLDVSMKRDNSSAIADFLLGHLSRPKALLGHLSRQRKDLSLVGVATRLRTKMGTAVFVVVFLLIFVPVAVGMVLVAFMCMESKASQKLSSPEAMDHEPLLDGMATPPGPPGRPITPTGGARRWTHSSIQSGGIVSHNLSRSSRSQEMHNEHSHSDVDCDTASLSSMGSGSALCTQLIVQTQQGVTLLVNGSFEPYQQEEVIDVSNTSRISSEVVLRIFMSEAGKDSGILLESPQRFPIAFLHTGSAVGPKDAPKESPSVQQKKQVLISRASCLTARTGVKNDNYFGLVRPLEGSAVVMTRGGEPGGPVLLTVNARVGTCEMSVADATGQIIASVQPRRQSQQPQHILHVQYDVDVAMVLCAVIAAVKLRQR